MKFSFFSNEVLGTLWKQFVNQFISAHVRWPCALRISKQISVMLKREFFFLAKICTLKTIINVVSKVMRYCIGLALLRSFIGSKNSLQTRSKKQMLN